MASLAGQNVSVPVTASINTLLISRALSAHGVNPSGVHFVDVPFVTALAALQAHRVAAIGMIEPFLSEAEAAGAQTLMPLCTGSTASLPLSGDFATASWVSRYPRTAAAFQRALAKAAAIASSNRAEDETMLKAHVKLSAAVAAQVHFNAYPAALQAAQIQKVADLMFGGGLLKSRLNVTPLLFKGTG